MLAKGVKSLVGRSLVLYYVKRTGFVLEGRRDLADAYLANGPPDLCTLQLYTRCLMQWSYLCPC